MKPTQSAHFDNIATANAPVWRKRVRKPFTCHAVRMELVAQAAQLAEWERANYIDERLTDLDRALSWVEADALERWLDCEELLQGCAKTVDWDGGSGGSGRSSPVPDDDMEALAAHAEMKRRLAVRHRSALRVLATMMQGGEWVLCGGFVRRVRSAALELTKLHSCVHSKLHSS
jgi:hypothetical protein